MHDGTDFSLFGLADLVNRTLTALDLDEVTLVGNDTGGAICQAVAAFHPERLARLVLRRVTPSTTSCRSRSSTCSCSAGARPG
jgi:pimeloyl-ACP methyl ester carboxylesterase